MHRCNTFCSKKLLAQDLLSHIHVSMISSYIVFIVAVPFLLIRFTIIWACMEAGWENKPSIGIKAPPFSQSSGQSQWKNAKSSGFHPNRTLMGMYHCPAILRSFSLRVVSNSAKRDANRFFNILLLSSCLLNSQNPCQKIKVWYMYSNRILFL